jgi:hypothetical protein
MAKLSLSVYRPHAGTAQSYLGDRYWRNGAGLRSPESTTFWDFGCIRSILTELQPVNENVLRVFCKKQSKTHISNKCDLRANVGGELFAIPLLQSVWVCT